jgi:alpha-L-rhamnosidase
MKISNIQVNHMNKPMGFNLSSLRIDFKIEDTNETNLKKQLIISSNDQVVYD